MSIAPSPVDALRPGELFMLGFRGETVPPWLRTFAECHGLGGVILFDYDVGSRRYERNVRDPAQVRALCAEVAALPGSPLVFVDQEGGKVRRLKESRGFGPLPSAREFARLPRDKRRAVARAAFLELRALGISYDLTPVIDLDLNPDNPDIGAVERAFSADPEVVRACAEDVAWAGREAGLGLCLKHWPGLGGARTNSHDELTDITDSLDQRQLELFDELAPTLPGFAILVSHGIVTDWEPGVPVSVSPAALGPLRHRLPDVLLISDDLQMLGLQKRFDTREACLRGLAAGIDLLIVGNNLMDEEAAADGFARAIAEAAAEDGALAARAWDAQSRVHRRKAAFADYTAAR